MGEKQIEAPAAAASTPEVLHKDSNNLLTSKALSPKFVSLTALDIKEHVEQLAGKPEPVKHEAILGELLKSIEPFDFENAVYKQAQRLRAEYMKLQSQLINPDGSEKGGEESEEIQTKIKALEKQLKGLKLNQKHYMIHTVENLLDIARRKNWGICKNDYFIYLYNGEYWANIEKEVFEAFLGEAAERMGVPKYDSRWVDFRKKLFEQFLATSYLPKPKKRKNVTLINLKNGTYEITPNGHKLRKFESSDFLTYQLPFDYNPKAQAPLFDKFINRVLPDKLLQYVLAEFIGYIFISVKYLKLEKALMLYGGGANGKSVFYEIVCALLGDENVSGFDVDSLTDKEGYHRAELPNKLVNYSSELSARQVVADKFKQLVSGEKMQARLPYGNPFTIVDFAKMIFNCNKLPRNPEHTHAFFRRCLIVPFEQTIPEHEQDKQLSKKIIEAELPGVFNWVLLGLNRVLAQKGLTDCPAVNNARKQYELDSNNVNQFIEDRGYKASATDYKPIVELYPDYRAFCIEDGCLPLKRSNFIEMLRQLKIVIEKKNIGNVAFLSKEYEPFY